jgi:hypothetical protein
LFSHTIFACLQSGSLGANPLLDWLIKLVLGGLIAAGGKILLDRYSVRTKSIEDLLKDVKDEKRISSRARQRLRNESEAALVDWKMQDKIAPETGRKLKEFPNKDDILVAREFARIGKDTPCPSGKPEDFSTPFFFHLNQNKDLVEELTKYFGKLAAKSPTSAELIQHRKPSQAGKLSVWVLAPNFEVRRKEEVLDLFYRLATEVRSWLPGARVALEIYLPDDMENLGKISLLRRAHDDTPEHNDLNPTARYVDARNSAHALFSKGCMLGKLRIPERYRVSTVFLRNRHFASLAELVINPQSWNTVAISGPPGSGKTELANLLAVDLHTRQHMIVLVASTPQLLKQLEIFLVYQTRKEAFEELANTIRSAPVNSLLVPTQFLTTVEEREAFSDALSEAFQSKKYPISILVDDLQAYNRLNSTLVKLSLEGKELGIRFILVGRIFETPREEERAGVIKMPCSLFSLEEAKQLLSEWASQKPQQELDDALQRDWPEKKEDFSLYLLRILVKHLSTFGETPSDLYENEIRNIVEPVGESLGIQRQIDSDRIHNIIRVLKTDGSAEKLLNEIRQLLVSETETNSVDPISLFGTISWFSRFGERDYITVENLINWGRAFALDERSAKNLLEAGIRAQIFNGNPDLASWYDPLVADGCAALYLGNEVVGLNHEQIATMVECLNESASIDILRLALDRNVLRKIILAVANVRPDLFEVVNLLLSSEFIARLAEKPSDVTELGEALFNQGRRVSPSNLKPLGLAISKLLPLSPQLNEFCWNAVAKSSTDAATLALAAKAAEWDGDYRYFSEAATYNSEPYMNRIAADMAARQWGEEGGLPLSRRLLELDFSEDELQRIWSLWCSERTGETLSLMIDKFLDDAAGDTIYESGYGVLAATSLKEIVLNKPPAERTQYLPRIQNWANTTRQLAQRGKVLAAARMVKWIAFAYGPELVNRESEWVISSDRVSALTTKSNPPADIQEAFRKIRSVVDKSGKVRFSLPSISELKSIPDSLRGSGELVRDKLGEDFQYSVEVDRKWLLVLNGNQQQPVTAEQFASQKFAWRLRLRMDSLST